MKQPIEVNPKVDGHSVADRIAHERGIVAEGENLDDALARVSKAVLEMDAQLEGRPNHDFANQLTKMFADRTAIPGAPILTKCGRTTEVNAGRLNFNVFRDTTSRRQHLTGGRRRFRSDVSSRLP